MTLVHKTNLTAFLWDTNEEELHSELRLFLTNYCVLLSENKKIFVYWTKMIIFESDSKEEELHSMLISTNPWLLLKC